MRRTVTEKIKVKYVKVLKRVYEPRRLGQAWQQVKKNAGAAGIDQMTVKDFERQKDELLKLIHQKLKAGMYRFKPARRTLIPKESTSKLRKLGIPVVMDRVASQSVNLVFQKIFDPEFTKSNYGFRKGMSQRQAIYHVQGIVLEGYEWCASIDLASFFDEIPHNLILKLIRRKIADEGLVTLIARALKAGTVVNGEFEKTTKGRRSSRQGCNPAGESPAVSVARVGYVVMPHLGAGNQPSYAWCKRPGCPVAFVELRWVQPGGLSSVGA